MSVPLILQLGSSHPLLILIKTDRGMSRATAAARCPVQLAPYFFFGFKDLAMARTVLADVALAVFATDLTGSPRGGVVGHGLAELGATLASGFTGSRLGAAIDAGLTRFSVTLAIGFTGSLCGTAIGAAGLRTTRGSTGKGAIQLELGSGAFVTGVVLGRLLATWRTMCPCEP